MVEEGSIRRSSVGKKVESARQVVDYTLLPRVPRFRVAASA